MTQPLAASLAPQPGLLEPAERHPEVGAERVVTHGAGAQLTGDGEKALRALNGILVFRRTKSEPEVAVELPDRIDELGAVAVGRAVEGGGVGLEAGVVAP